MTVHLRLRWSTTYLHSKFCIATYMYRYLLMLASMKTNKTLELKLQNHVPPFSQNTGRFVWKQMCRWYRRDKLKVWGSLSTCCRRYTFIVPSHLFCCGHWWKNWTSLQTCNKRWINISNNTEGLGPARFLSLVLCLANAVTYITSGRNPSAAET